jgi:acylphosphatase
MKMKTKVNSKRPKGHAAEVVVFGVVQGVGFRPFVYRLAHEFHYKGWVKNIGFGVEIHVESEEKTDFKEFLKALQEKKPPLSQIEEIIPKTASFRNVKDFGFTTLLSTALIADPATRLSNSFPTTGNKPQWIASKCVKPVTKNTPIPLKEGITPSLSLVQRAVLM